MATLEQFGVLLQINDQITRLARNMRANASDYIVKANAGFDPVILGQVMKADANQFIIRLQTLTDIATRNLALVQSALGIIGVTVAQANAIKTTLADTAAHVIAATLTAKQQCIDEANAILSTASNFDGLY